MALFNRRRTADPSRQLQAIEDFWHWWRAEGAQGTAQAVADKEPMRAAEALGSRVAAIHPGLAWELAAGMSAQHQLVVTSEGNPDLRAAAARWLRGAPAQDPLWEYADARQPVRDLAGVTLQLNDHEVIANQACVVARVRGAEVDVTVHHPSFVTMDEQERHMVAFLLLDAVLGEVAVEAWIGELSTTELPLPDAIGLGFLRGVVDEVAAGCLGPDGSPVWVMGQGADAQGHEVLAVAQAPLKSVLWPHLDTHVSVEVPYRELTENGWPGEDSLSSLRHFETHLSERVDPSGRLVAHTSINGVRTLHFYVDGATPAAEQLRAAVRGWDQGQVQVSVSKDAGWERVAHLRM